MSINDLIVTINNFLWGWPLIAFFIIVSCIISIALNFIQFRYFFTAWKLLLSPATTEEKNISADMTPLQAFLNALSTSLGNGSLGGIATALFSGGPGAAVWVFVFGLFGMSIRFCEVFLSKAFGTKQWGNSTIGGPMVYLSKIPGGSFLPYVYALFCFFLSLSTGNAMQANTIAIGCMRIFHVSTLTVACVLLAFMLYVMLGGAKRIVAVSNAIVPIKVGVFFISSFIVLAYHYKALLPALSLIIKAAFTPQAVFGALAGYSVQQAIRFGIARTLNASEAGLGVAAVIFGGSTSQEPAKEGIMSMLGSFISANLVCFSIAVMIIASGVWNNGQTSLDLTISAYETVFGAFGGWLVTFLSVTFGLGVLVSYGYIARNCWLFLTKGRFVLLCNVMFCIATFLGALAKVDLIWNITDLVNAFLLFINLLAILFLLPIIKHGLKQYEAKTN